MIPERHAPVAFGEATAVVGDEQGDVREGERRHVASAEEASEEELASGGAGKVAAADDVSSQALWRTARGQVLAKAGDVDAGIVLAGEAVELLRATDFLVTLADALTELASVLEDAARGRDAAAALGEAVALYERKGNIVAAAAARDRLAAAAAL